jgi:hypothetical protein
MVSSSTIRNTQKFILSEKSIRSVVSTNTAAKLCPPFQETEQDDDVSCC